MARENRAVAKDLRGEEKFRSSISRSYYAAYCAVTSVLADSITFGYGGNNPTHNELPNFIMSNLGGISMDERHKIRKAVAKLFKARTDADYVPTASVGQDEAFSAVRQMNIVFRILEIKDE